MYCSAIAMPCMNVQELPGSDALNHHLPSVPNPGNPQLPARLNRANARVLPTTQPRAKQQPARWPPTAEEVTALSQYLSSWGFNGKKEPFCFSRRCRDEACRQGGQGQKQLVSAPPIIIPNLCSHQASFTHTFRAPHEHSAPTLCCGT